MTQNDWVPSPVSNQRLRLCIFVDESQALMNSMTFQLIPVGRIEYEPPYSTIQKNVTRCETPDGWVLFYAIPLTVNPGAFVVRELPISVMPTTWLIKIFEDRSFRILERLFQRHQSYSEERR